MPNGKKYAGGLDLNFYPNAQFEDENAESILEKTRIKARNLLRVLMMGWTPSWSNLITREVLKAVFVQRDHLLTQAMRHAFQQGFSHIFSQLQGKQLSPLEKNQADLYISNCLSYLPYADLSRYESMPIPQYTNGNWQLVDYQVVPIELTSTSGFKKLFLADHDRVFAYGLEPINHAYAESHLIFMGTTYPAGQGFSTMINTDLEAFETAGKKLYRTGQTNIIRWLNQQTNKVHVCGMSLGGALTQLLAIDKGGETFQKGATFSRFDALNPPGLYDPFRKSKFDNWDSFEIQPPVYIQKQGDDVVSWFGKWKTEWHILQVNPPADKKGPNGGVDHALNYAGFAGTEFLEVDAHIDNQERKSRNWWLYTLLRSLVYYTLLVPTRYLILPLLRFVFSHKIQLLLTLAAIPLFMQFPVIPLFMPLSLALNTLLPAIISGYLISTLIDYCNDRISGKNNSELSKFMAMMNQKPLLGVAVGIFTTVIIASIVLSWILFPTLTPTLTLAFTSLPLVVTVLDKIVDSLQILLGYNRIEPAQCHNPALMRNQNLDIYSNDTEVTFSYGQLHDYYQAKRPLKNKLHLPEEKLTFFKRTQETKRDVILKGQPNKPTREQNITFLAKKAKVIDMKRTLGIDASDRETLLQQQQAYTAGKPTPR